MYSVSMICKETGEAKIELCFEKDLKVLDYDIPKKVNSTKIIQRYDSFMGLHWLTIITKIDNR